jgi:Mn-dependent transcriptional regulator
MLDVIFNLLRERGPLTSSAIAARMNKKPGEVIAVLRNAINTGLLVECNGFYNHHNAMNAPRRTSYEWVEGHQFPVKVMRLAHGPKGCESVSVLAEMDSEKQKQGWPWFQVAVIDVRMGHIKCCSTGEFITDHVLRYLPLDTAAVRETWSF